MPRHQQQSVEDAHEREVFTLVAACMSNAKIAQHGRHAPDSRTTTGATPPDRAPTGGDDVGGNLRDERQQG
ncbi:hypothetical protein ACQPZF_16820 [Actinosynnema sp. CS-041913]|uniref:hypothetical protein n=1 Tax=Actinosynnema sp. CS-041913 TaxID=3239917 RepID=UPI003D8BDE83